MSKYNLIILKSSKSLKYVLAFLLTFICCIWMFFSKIEIGYLLFWTLNVISFAAGYYFPDTILSLSALKLNKKSVILILLTSFYSAFATVGSKGIVYPIDSHISIGRIVELSICTIWYIVVLLSIIGFLYKSRTSDDDKAGLHLYEYIILFSIIFVPLIVMLITFNPAICSYDTNLCLSIYAHDLTHMINNQPFFYVLFLKCIIFVTDSTYAIVIVQILLWCATWMEAFAFLNERMGVDFKTLFFIAIIITVNSSNLLYVVTIWKDIPYTICILLISILISELIYGVELNACACMKLIVSMCGVFMFRKNGPVTFGFIIVALIVFGIKHKTDIKRLALCIILSCLFIWFINCPLYRIIGVKEDVDAKGTMYVGLSQELFAAYKYGDVSEETEKMLNVLARGDLENYGYNPYWANAAYNLDVDPMDFIFCYTDTLIHNPRIVIKSILLRQDCLWNVFPGEDSWVNLVNYFGGWDDTTEWRQYYPDRYWGRFNSFVADIVRYPGDDSSLNILVWRSGFHVVILMLVITATLVISNYRSILYVVFPIAGQMVSLILSTGWSDFRYYWSINVVTLYIVTMSIFVNRTLKT